MLRYADAAGVPETTHAPHILQLMLMLMLVAIKMVF